MSCITTITGKSFDPVSPEREKIDERDIAHALSNICRANGYTKVFYSVAQHSIACAREAETRNAPSEVVLGCLLHDASEAYLSDVTRPVKGLLPQYLEIESVLQDMIWEKYIGHALTDSALKEIFAIDDQMLSMEFHQLMPADLNNDYRKLVGEVRCAYRPQPEVKEEFLRMLKRLAGNV